MRDLHKAAFNGRVAHPRHGPGLPLELLPLSCLSLVLAHLRLRDAAALAGVSQRFCRAFRDEVAWRHRCEAEPGVIERYDGSQTFRALFREHGPWRVRILSLDHKGKRLSSYQPQDEFYVLCRPTTTVAQFLELASTSTRVHRGLMRLQTMRPFDPGSMQLEKGRIPHAWLPDWPRPNCTFDASNPDADIRAAGLGPEAVLAVERERLFLD